MIDQFGLPRKNTGGINIFYATTSTTGTGIQTWSKPKGATFVSIMTLGGGGGGGGGFTKTVGGAGGGGGGASSGIARFFCPAILLPDELYIQVGVGGAGGAANTNGIAGTNSYVSTSRTFVLPNLICYSNTVASPASRGTAGSGSGGGVGGSAPGISITQGLNTWGHWFSQNGGQGFDGGAHTGAVGVAASSVWNALPTSGGAGGAGTSGSDFAGGGLTATNAVDWRNQGRYSSGAGSMIAGGVAGGGNGNPGVKRVTPFLNSGGTGGGSFFAGQAGNGGNGGYGCGGGGGGGGTTGGNGGDGGDGLVIITWF